MCTGFTGMPRYHRHNILAKVGILLFYASFILTFIGVVVFVKGIFK
jgi:hypothetical protein